MWRDSSSAWDPTRSVTRSSSRRLVLASPRDVQEAASHADPRTTIPHDRAPVSLDRYATYVVAMFLAGASR
jgi:hypothetical protein